MGVSEEYVRYLCYPFGDKSVNGMYVCKQSLFEELQLNVKDVGLVRNVLAEPKSKAAQKLCNRIRSNSDSFFL
jgi:hypothetical protein